MSGLGKSETRGKMYCHVIIVACQVLKDPHIDQKQQHKNTWKDVSAIASSAAAACARIPPWMTVVWKEATWNLSMGQSVTRITSEF